MTRDELIAELRELRRLDETDGDTEAIHSEADKALLAYINDPLVSDIYNSLDKWYA